ncbi:putative leucine-rich repeat-containing protein DDB_G0290503 isoform X1 [Harpegnathos saltator]|uniref:putative leucine-rich repeat-containing protein DDB_G0290503 isoform X1 n=1 Tax=Harpegnathos saltator TaxID=610380 RepID=UPI000DBEDF87|nr:putative leucine-rich repeat-containing protein DDB_G0290503 isoform X1 [Harpegnathos saltator]
MSSPRSIGGSIREGTRVVLKEITATLHNSTQNHLLRRKSGGGGGGGGGGNGNDSPVPKTPEHEVKVRFTREFADVGPVVTCSVSESLSSASSFHSLSSTLSTKSSSGICPDSSFDASYTNSNIPGVEDLILACADIHLRDEVFENAPAANISVQDFNLSQDQTFTSATDESQLHTNDFSFNENLLKFDNIDVAAADSEETQLIEKTKSSQLLNTTHEVLLNQTHTSESSSSSTLPLDEKESVAAIEEEYVSQTEEKPTEKLVASQESDDIASEAETRSSVTSSTIKDSSVASNVDGDQLYATATLSPDNSFASVATVNDEQTVESQHSAETLSEDFESCATHISAPSTSEVLLAQYAENPCSIPNISDISSPLENTENNRKNNSAHDLSGVVARDVSESTAALSPVDDTNQKLFTPITVNSSDVRAEGSEVGEEAQDSLQLDKLASVTQLLSETTGITESGTSEISKENLQTSLDTQDSAARSSADDTFASKEDIIISNENRVVEQHRDPSETIVIQRKEDLVDSAASTVAKKKSFVNESLDRTLTLQEVDLDFAAASSDDQYLDFKPQRQSTTLTLPKEKPNFEEFKSTAEKVTNDLLNSSLEFAEETDTFVSATSTIFQDPSTFDFLLARSNSRHAVVDRLRKESLYVKFDPLVSNASMLPQGNAQSINEKQNEKNESPLPNVGTPKRNPAIAAIDRLLFYSPLPSGTMQKLEEAQEKNEQPVEEPKSDAPLIADINIAEELELVRSTVLRLEDELEKQKKHEVDLEKQKATFQEKINKLQAQVAQEVKMKTQMSVVVEEYEKSISRLLTERERDRTNFEQEKAKLQEELQAANHHLTNTEAAFNDVHQKYERLKGVVSVYKNNEAVLKESIQENVDTIKTLETRYDQLKDHAMAQLEKANLELDGIRKQNEAETVKLHAMIRKAELKSNSLAELVEQKTKENKELAKILDEVIARVGHGNQE